MNQNLSEERLWGALRRDALGVRFRSQFAVEGYVLDFYCAKARLCIEVDGEVHQFRQREDAERDAALARRGILVLRVSSFDVWGDLDGVVERIREVCMARLSERGISLPAPPP